MRRDLQQQIFAAERGDQLDTDRQVPGGPAFRLPGCAAPGRQVPAVPPARRGGLWCEAMSTGTASRHTRMGYPVLC
ncbi:hypothetical protein C8258_17675 [Nocardia sp. MDA0666]|nr:hypothetical protein C8258_17675 [Nocardia sp. MDA0666]